MKRIGTKGTRKKKPGELCRRKAMHFTTTNG